MSWLKTNFLKQWYVSKNLVFPNRLMDHWQQLFNEGILTAYHQWILGDIINPNDYKKWQVEQAKAFVLFQQFQQSRVFKIPVGQYYFNN